MTPVGVLWRAVREGHKILICGNGGSATQASHFAAELVVRYKFENRLAIPCIALNDPAILTACANDLGYERVFARQVEAYGDAGDCLIAISTSGKSLNVIAAMQAAAEADMQIIALTGIEGMSGHPPERYQEVRSHSQETDVVQEEHMRLLHIWAETLELLMVDNHVAITGNRVESGE